MDPVGGRCAGWGLDSVYMCGRGAVGTAQGAGGQALWGLRVGLGLCLTVLQDAGGEELRWATGVGGQLTP